MNVKTQTTEALLQILGSERSSYPTDLVAAAESEVSRRTAGEEELFRTKIERSGTICIWLGGFFVVWGLSMALMGLFVFETGGPAHEESFVFRNFNVLYVGGAILQAVTGLGLLWGGMGLRKLQDVGRIIVLAVLWVGFACLLLFTVAMLSDVVSYAEASVLLALIMAAGVTANSVFWAFLLWLPLRFFRSPRVREVCSG
ncbi:MAG: hypothetical protein OEM62_03325 [Acidobacteriota bacterium]|nr:hypothetical protein [Acidobacteriota bacterium]